MTPPQKPPIVSRNMAPVADQYDLQTPVSGPLSQSECALVLAAIKGSTPPEGLALDDELSPKIVHLIQDCRLENWLAGGRQN